VRIRWSNALNAATDPAPIAITISPRGESSSVPSSQVTDVITETYRCQLVAAGDRAWLLGAASGWQRGAAPSRPLVAPRRRTPHLAAGRDTRLAGAARQ
jgi:hypothetical protein